MTRRLEDRVAIVTGAASGIGAACARRFASEGAKVMVADINEPGAVCVANDIVQAGGIAVAHQFDLADPNSIKALLAATVDRFGTLAILHNNAADLRRVIAGQDMLVADMDIETWDSTFAANARGTMLMIKHALPIMLAAGGGVIVNTTSGAAARGDVYNPSYAASKAAIESLTRYVAMQYGKQGIRCNSVAPGLIVTETMKASFHPEQTRLVDRQTLTPYDGTPEDVAAVVAFFASDDSRFVTAQMLPVDGGILTHMPHSVDMAEFLSAGAA